MSHLSRRALVAGGVVLAASRSRAAKQLCSSVADAPSGGGGGGGPPITNSCTSTYPCTFPLTGVAQVLGAAIGVANATRMVVVTAAGYRSISASDVVAATFNGVSVRVAGVLGPPYGPNEGYCAIAWGMVPTGTTVDVTMTFASAVGAMHFTVCYQVGGPNPYVRDVAALNGTGGLTASPVMPAGGYGFASFVGSVGANGPTTWGGATVNFDQSDSGAQNFQMSTAVGTVVPVTATNANTQHSLAMVTVGSAGIVASPTIVQSAVSSQASGAPTVTLPLLPTPGNLMVALTNIYVHEPPLAGWVDYNFSGQTQNMVCIYLRVVQAGDGKTQSPTGGYASQPSSVVIYEIANFDNGWGSPTNAQGPGASGIASFFGNTIRTAATSYSNTVSTTFNQVLILGIVEMANIATPPTVGGVTIDQTVTGSGLVRAVTAFHMAVNAGSYPITANFSASDTFAWNTCVIAPRYS